jgi:hypothetical protein
VIGLVAALAMRATFQSPLLPSPSPLISHFATQARRSLADPPIVFITLQAVLELCGDHRVARNAELGRDSGTGSVWRSFSWGGEVEGDILDGVLDGKKMYKLVVLVTIN